MLERLISLGTDIPGRGYMPDDTAEALGIGGSTTLIGVLIVFAALVCLIFITWLYPKIALGLIDGVKNRKSAKEIPVKKPVVSDPIAVQAPAAATDDTALVAVITAAIAASMRTSSNGISIKSIRRSRSNTPAWGTEGRNEQIYNRF